MYYPPIDKKLLASYGVQLPARPCMPDYGIKFSTPTGPPEKITSAQAINLFGESDAVKMNFVPQMLTAVAMETVTKLCNHCRDKRYSEMRSSTRLLRKCVEN